MEININRIVYNLFEKNVSTEQVSVEIMAKFGVSKEDVYDRAFFFEISINGEDIENKINTRDFLLLATGHYKLDTNEFPDLDKQEIKADDIAFYNGLQKLNEIIYNATSHDDFIQPLHITEAIEKLKNNDTNEIVE